MTRAEIYQAIEAERHEQDREWGGERHDDKHGRNDWISYIVKHLGRTVTGAEDQFIKQMVRVAALAVAAIEWANRTQAARQTPPDRS